MTPGDLLRAITPGAKQPEGNILVNGTGLKLFLYTL